MNTNSIKNVLYVGLYSKDYSRNYTFINGLKKQNINVYEINLANLSKYEGIKKLLRNFKKYKNIKFDLLIFYDIRIAPISFILTRAYAFIKRIPFVYDFFISKCLTYFADRNLNIVKKKKIQIKLYYWIYYYLLDFFECHLSNYVILDTLNHIKYFHKVYNVPIRKFRRIFVGAREDLYYPRQERKNNKEKFIVGYWGSYIPLHGVEFIINAFKLLDDQEDISFCLVGVGQTYKKNRELEKKLNIKNIKFIPKIFLGQNKEELPELISNFDIGLGIFGNSEKTMLVIPNKVFEGIAMKIPMITCESPAIKELFNENENIILSKHANSESLAEAILRLKNDENLREKIKGNAFNIFQNHCTIEQIGKKLKLIFNQMVRKKNNTF